ncbi:plasmid mobilization protein MobA [Burkholderia multivorans]|uniref:plasmid mobilization protein MobA n=1 Tax=Burkholderia multivorans TaxID=87883 RepID=UPI00345EDCCE
MRSLPSLLRASPRDPDFVREMGVTVSTSEQRRRTGMLPPIRCYEDEEALVRERARDCGMSVGQFVLAAALGRRTRTKIEAHILNELRRLGGLQKHLFNEGGGMLSKEYAAILVELREAIARIGD